MVTVRRYSQADFQALWELHTLALNSVDALARDSYFADLQTIEAVYLQNGGEFLVAEVNNVLVAVGGLKRTAPDRAEITRMRVYPGYQRMGYGSIVLHHLEARALELDYTTLHLDTLATQVEAQRFYCKHGYRRVGQGAKEEFEVVFFEKRLGV